MGGGTDKTPGAKSLQRSIFLDNDIRHCFLSVYSFYGRLKPENSIFSLLLSHFPRYGKKESKKPKSKASCLGLSQRAKCTLLSALRGLGSLHFPGSNICTPFMQMLQMAEFCYYTSYFRNSSHIRTHIHCYSRGSE
jgi:hypothetical protein